MSGVVGNDANMPHIQKAPEQYTDKLRVFMAWRKKKGCKEFTVKANLGNDRYVVNIINEAGTSCNGLSDVSIDEAVDSALDKVFKIWLPEEKEEWTELNKST